MIELRRGVYDAIGAHSFEPQDQIGGVERYQVNFVESLRRKRRKIVELSVRGTRDRYDGQVEVTVRLCPICGSGTK